MANALGRISGQLLKDNLTREGNELAFDTDLLFLNVSDRRIGANTDVPTKPLDINGTTTTTNLIVDELLDVIKLGTQVRISGSTLTSLSNNLNLTASNYVVGDNVRTSKLDFNNNVISSLATDTKIEIRPDQSGVDPLLFGSLEIYSNLNVTGDVYTPYNITIGGNIIFGSDSNDTITFGADVNTDIIPDQNEIYSLGSTGQKWEGIYTELINGEQVTSNSIASGGVDLALLQGKIWYVATNGSDVANPELTQGKHQNAPFASIGQALSQATVGDTVYIYPGTYTEIFPLTVPVGVAVKGTGIRSVNVQPTVPTQSNNAFLLNGESTVSDLTVRDFYAPGYAFSFAPGFTVSTRSPYVQNITVITKGSITTLSDPRGFDQGDAGGGARVDGSLATASSKEASMLFHSVTFITPGADALVMTNGVRVEWLNSFTYFANRGLYATNGTLGLASLGVRFGAELRSIGSANVYGVYGAEANGASTLMYLIQHNFAYIGAGKDVTNDPSLNIAANETVEIAAGKIYYQSLDNKGNFKVGDAFGVSFETGLVNINGVSVSAGGVSSINFAVGTAETVIDAEQITTGNVKFSNNLLTTLSGAINLNSGTNEIKLNANTSVTDNLDIIGNLNTDGTLTIGNAYIDIVRFTAPVEFALRPKTDNSFTLGGPTNKRWDNVYLDTSYIGSYKLENSTISTLPTDADIELRADGTGRIFVNQDNVEFDQDLTVSGITNLGDNALTAAATVNGIIDHLGLLDRTGDTGQTGTYNQTGYLDVSSNVQIVNVTFIDNTVSTSTLDSNLELGAASTGKVKIPSANVQIDHNLFVISDISAGSVGVNTDTTADSYTNGNIEISLDLITTTLTDSDLEFRAAGTGKVYASQDNVKFDQDLTVNGTINLKNTVIGSSALTSSLSFSSSNYLSLSAAQTIGTQAYTFECFFYTASNGLQTILGASATGGMSIWLLGDGINPVNIIQIDRSNIDAAQYTVSPITLNTWHHLAVTRDNLNNASVFLDGVKATGSASNTANYTASSGLIGAVAGSAYFFTGYLTQIKLAVGSNYYDPTAASISVPTAVLTISANTKLLLIVANSSAYITDTSGTQTVSNIGGITYSATGPSTSNITHIGNYLQTGNTVQTGNRSISSTLDVDSNAYFDSMSFVNNTITTTDTDTDLSLKTAGSGLLVFDKNTTFGQGLTVDTLVVTGLTNSGTITTGTLFDNDIQITSNIITTTVGNNDLRLLAAGAGIISMPLDPVLIDTDLLVTLSSSLKNTTIIGNLLHAGDTNQTGNVDQTGNLDISNNLTVTGSNAFFTDIRIIDNSISTSIGNNDLRLLAASSGIIDIDDNATFNQNLRVNGIVYSNGITNSVNITSDIFTDSDIEINDNYITTTVGNNNLILIGNGTGGPTLEKIKFNSNTISTESSDDNITLTVPSGSVTISSTTALTVPVGTGLNRPTLIQGDLRFNTTDVSFNGFSTAKVTLGGVSSADLRTKVSVHPTNNTLTFTANNLTALTVLSTGFALNRLTVDNNLTFTTNTISTTNTNEDLYLTPDGIGQVQIDSIAVDADEILNLNSSGALILQNTGAGYVSFGGTGAIGIPVGPTVVNVAGIERGDFRFNTDLSIIEIFNGTAYEGLSGTTGGLLNAEEVQEITNLWALVLG